MQLFSDYPFWSFSVTSLPLAALKEQPPCQCAVAKLEKITPVKTFTLSSGGFLPLCACKDVVPLPLCPGDTDCPPEQCLAGLWLGSATLSACQARTVQISSPAYVLFLSPLQHFPDVSSYVTARCTWGPQFWWGQEPCEEGKQSESSVQPGPGPGQIRLPEPCGDQCTHDCPCTATICCGQRGSPGCCWAAHGLTIKMWQQLFPHTQRSQGPR